MDFNLTPWLFTWNQLFFIFYVLIAVVPTTKLLFENNKKVTSETTILFLTIFGKVGLDTALVMGISGAAIAMMGSLINFEYGENAYYQASYIVGTLFFGVALTGVSFCVHSNENELAGSITYKLDRSQTNSVIFMIISVALIQMYICDLDIFNFWTGSLFVLWQLTMFFLWAYLGSLAKKPKLQCAIEANVASTFVSVAFGIVFWFAEGNDYLSSRNNIFVVTRSLFIGSFIHLILYYISLSKGDSDLGNYKIKTWHFAEAASFFVFLVLAPVGLTEFSRESEEQVTLQNQHEAQQQEIEELKSQIRKLSMELPLK